MSYTVPRKQKKDEKKQFVPVQGRKRGKRVPITIKGMGTFYIERKMMLIGALASFVLFIIFGVYLWWLWTVRIPSITG